MVGNDRWFDEPGDRLRDDEFPEADEIGEDQTVVVACPHCGAEVYEDAVQCPACGAYITHPTDGWSGRPRWWIVLGLLGILAVILVLLRC